MISNLSSLISMQQNTVIQNLWKTENPKQQKYYIYLSNNVSDQHLNETSDQLNSSIQINQKEILLSLAPAIQEEIQMELRMPNKTTVTKILTQQQNVQIAFQRKATPQNRKQDNQFMTLFPGLNLDQIRNNANTITRKNKVNVILIKEQHVTPLLNQKLLSTKRSPKQTPLARKSQRRVCEEV
ncbi:Hypothetical_protein [Hexamita inflata]|uniref:Hypothetical_protein n=1 Tax=Hexamita inflata TaxID=28002 RepID=A0ABP1HCB6_9EUKA